ncbi:hypothetical protein [Neobacillus mesonae]|uniref:hypothetical protein n=1 Tax=Neobacillus mesonae TaxID=1193713 RepID=UPI00204123A4|nr:hypothetical protein [Neobacillus mesonae]MCM3566880.1 hypothetical protein [Neobacillus mesonae]
MIVASDLDRTLMYSARAMSELGGIEETKLTGVEWMDGRWTGFMTNKAYENLKNLSAQALFIPVTTRTTEQFNRFVIFKEDIPLSYAITTNGAVILYHGEPLEDWSDYILEKMKSESAPMDEMFAVLKQEGFCFTGTLRSVENLFFYYTLTSSFSSVDKNNLQTLASMYGWRISLQGRKLYLIPKSISKGAALDYICQKEGMKTIAGAGDSLLDWDFLKNCSYRFVPIHGELKNLSETYDFTIIDQSGIMAGEVILREFQRLFRFNNDFFNQKEIKTGK